MKRTGDMHYIKKEPAHRGVPSQAPDQKLSCIRDFEAFLALKDDWNRLLSESANDTVFLRHEWLSSWWASYGGRAALNVLVLKKGSRLVAAAPLMTHVDRMRGLPARKVSFIGDPSWMVGDFIVGSGAKNAVRMFMEHILDMSWDVAELRNVPEGSASIGQFSEMMESMSLDYRLAEGASSPFVRVEMPWKDFYASRSTRFKKSIRNKINKINKSGSVGVKRYSSPEEVARVLPVVFDIGLKGWKHTIRNAISSTPENRSFYSKLGAEMSALGRLDIWVLEFDGTPVAFEYHVRHGERTHALVADFDEGYRHISPGSVLDFNIMQHIFENGTKEYDMGCGDSFYKAHWSSTARKHLVLNFSRNTLYGRTLMFVEKRIVPILKTCKETLKKKGQPEAAGRDDNGGGEGEA